MELILTNVRLAFPEIFEPKASEDGGSPRCSLSAILEGGGENLANVRKVIHTVGVEKWKDKAGDILKELSNKDRLCLRSGDDSTKAKYAGFPGNMYVSCSNESRPVVVGRDRSPLVKADGKPYAGCYVNVKIDVWAQDNKYGKRVNAKLLVVQFVADGEAFGGGAVGRAEDMPDLGDAPGATVGNDPFADDIPF